MKATLNFICLFILLVAGITSCKKETNGTMPPPDPITVSELIQYKNNDEFVKFDYNTDNSIAKVTVKSDFMTNNEEMVYNIQYAGNKIEALTTATGQQIRPVYEDSIITRADIFENGERISYSSYYYRNNQLVKSILYFHEEANNYIPILDYSFEYNNAGNISETTVFVAGEPNQMIRAGHSTMQYDNHINPLYKHRELLALFWQAASKNNVTSENYFDADFQPEDSYVYSYTYTYLDNGLPKKAEVKQQKQGGAEENYNIEFIYN